MRSLKADLGWGKLLLPYLDELPGAVGQTENRNGVMELQHTVTRREFTSRRLVRVPLRQPPAPMDFKLHRTVTCKLLGGCGPEEIVTVDGKLVEVAL